MGALSNVFLQVAARSLAGPLSLLLLSACSPSDPMPLSSEQALYVGHWQYLFEEKSDQHHKVKNVMLRINPDSSAYYMKCVFMAEGYESDTGSYSRTARSSVSLPSARVIGMAPGEIELEQSVEWFHFDYSLEVSEPSRRGDSWVMAVDGVELAKVDAAQAVDIANWYCPDSDED